MNQGRQRRRVRYGLTPHYHPWTEELIRKLNTDGLPALLDAEVAVDPGHDADARVLHAGPGVHGRVPEGRHRRLRRWAVRDLQLGAVLPRPVLIAVHLSKNQRFEEAQRWFHHVFDPTSTDTSIDPPQRFWKFLRFREETDPEFITRDPHASCRRPATASSSGARRRPSRRGGTSRSSRTSSRAGATSPTSTAW